MIFRKMKTLHTLWVALTLLCLMASCADGPTPAVDTKQKLLGNWHLISVQNFTSKYTFISLQSNGNCFYSSSAVVDEHSNLLFWSYNKNNTFRLYSNSDAENYSFTLEFAVNDDLILTQGNSVCIYRRYQNERDLEMPYRVMGFWQLADAADAGLQPCAYLELDYNGQGRAYDADLIQWATFTWQADYESVTLRFDQQGGNLTLSAAVDEKGQLKCSSTDGHLMGSYNRCQGF